ncbi:MAG: type II toxin-antitoxin system RelB/DinJ family antitoxin [Clostridiales Family XIII bacterium]|jgi:DNA-damage-inducible protein J|nr:type II toxin-antitoxin system RelB/DinJ family antitoxin [Clostridiales Family XIII bacterium]
MSVQVSTRIDEVTKRQFDLVCASIGISPSNALSMFIKGVINYNGIPFSPVAPIDDGYRKPNAELRKAMEDVRLRRNLHGPYNTVDEAMTAMLED